MKKGAKLLLGTHDFSTYRAASCGAKSPIRTMEKILIKKTKIKLFYNLLLDHFYNNKLDLWLVALNI